MTSAALSSSTNAVILSEKTVKLVRHDPLVNLCWLFPITLIPLYAQKYFQEDLCYDFPREKSETDKSVAPWVAPLAFFKDVHRIIFSPVIRKREASPIFHDFSKVVEEPCNETSSLKIFRGSSSGLLMWALFIWQTWLSVCWLLVLATFSSSYTTEKLLNRKPKLEKTYKQIFVVTKRGWWELSLSLGNLNWSKGWSHHLFIQITN